MKAPGRDIGGHEERKSASHEVVDDAEPLALRQVARQMATAMAVALELLGQPEGAVPHIGEDQGVAGFFFGQNAEQQVGLEVALDPIQLLDDRVHGHLFGSELDEDRIIQVVGGDPPRNSIQRCAEEHALPGGAGDHAGKQSLDVRKKPHIEQAVGLVDHQKTHLFQVEKASLAEVEKPARRADGHIDAFSQ